MAESRAMVIDTHADIRELVAVGMPERQAEACVRLKTRLVIRPPTTQADIDELREEMRADVEKLVTAGMPENQAAVVVRQRIRLAEYMVIQKVGFEESSSKSFANPES